MLRSVIQSGRRRRARAAGTTDRTAAGEVLDVIRARHDPLQYRHREVVPSITRRQVSSLAARSADSASRIDNTANRAEAYVDITRGQRANHLYLTAAADPLDGEHLPMAPTPPVGDMIANHLARSNGEITAWELHEARDPDRGDLVHAVGL